MHLPGLLQPGKLLRRNHRGRFAAEPFQALIHAIIVGVFGSCVPVGARQFHILRWHIGVIAVLILTHAEA